MARGRPLSHRRVLIVGGGLAGLVAAHRLTRAPDPPEVRLLEAEDRPGGKIRTDRVDGFVAEAGADAFAPASGAVTDLLGELELAGDVVQPRPTRVRAYLRRHRGLTPLLTAGRSPLASPHALLGSPVLGWPGRLRVLLEPLVPRRRVGGDESVASLVRRRLGSAALQRVFRPLMSGVYGSDPDELSAGVTLPRLVAAERSGESLLRVGRGSSAYMRAGQVSLATGMAALPEALAASLPEGALRTGSRVVTVRRDPAGWHVELDDGTTHSASALLLALPAGIAADLLADEPELSTALRALPSARVGVVNVALPPGAVSRSLDAHGYLNAPGVGGAVSGCTWSSAKFDGRAPTGHTLLRVFVRGAALAPPDADGGESTVAATALDELREALDVRAEPLWSRVHFWSAPLYRVGHAERIREVERGASDLPGLALAGASYGGVGVDSVVRSATAAAGRLVASSS